MDKGTTKVLSTILKITGVLSFAIIVIFFIYDGKILSILLGKETTTSFFTATVCMLLFIFVALILIIANAVLQSREGKHRTEDLQKLAQQQGWKYETQQHLAFLPELAHQIGLTDGSGIQGLFDSPNLLDGTSINVLQGQISGRNVLVCDQIYYVQGESHRKVTQTIVGIEIKEANLPFFTLSPKGSIEKFLKAVNIAYTDPSLPKEFTDKYDIERQNHINFNHFFNAQICDFYLKQLAFTTVCGGRYLVIYDHGAVLNPQQILDKLKFIEAMANLFLRSNSFR